jgi:hypothetical protein
MTRYTIPDALGEANSIFRVTVPAAVDAFYASAEQPDISAGGRKR